jgi:hypothetical protein
MKKTKDNPKIMMVGSTSKNFKLTELEGAIRRPMSPQHITGIFKSKKIRDRIPHIDFLNIHSL